MKAFRRFVLMTVVLLALLPTLSGCVFGSPYAAYCCVSPVSAVTELFAGDGSDAEPGPTHRDRR